MLDKLRAKLVNKGFNPDKMPWAVGCFIVCDFLYTFALASVCFVYSPTERLVARLPAPKLRAKLAAFKAAPKEWKLLSLVAPHRRPALALSLCEMLVLKSLLRPVALPTLFWVSYKLTIT